VSYRIDPHPGINLQSLGSPMSRRNAA
jgi:hypothetical protein